MMILAMTLQLSNVLGKGENRLAQRTNLKVVTILRKCGESVSAHESPIQINTP